MIYTDTGYAFVPDCNKQQPEPMSTKMSDVILLTKSTNFNSLLYQGSQGEMIRTKEINKPMSHKTEIYCELSKSKLVIENITHASGVNTIKCTREHRKYLQKGLQFSLIIEMRWQQFIIKLSKIVQYSCGSKGSKSWSMSLMIL